MTVLAAHSQRVINDQRRFRPWRQLFTRSRHLITQFGRFVVRERVKSHLIHVDGRPGVNLGTPTAPRPCARPWRGVGTRRAIEEPPAIMPDAWSAGDPKFRSVEMITNGQT